MNRNTRFAAAFLPVLFVWMLCAEPAAATTLTFGVAPGNVGVNFQNTNVDVFSTGLNGTVLSGQAMSLDLDLAGDLLARLTLANVSELGVGLTVFTNGATSPGNAGTTTGFLLNPVGNQLGPNLDAGRSESDGSFSMALVFFPQGSLGSSNIVDISGAHFSTIFPSSGFTVTDARLRFTLGTNGLQFGTPAQLPEASTVALSLAGISFGLLLTYKRVAAGR